MKCTKYVNGYDCGKEAVLIVNDEAACEEHAPELAQLSDVGWPVKKEKK